MRHKLFKKQFGAIALIVFFSLSTMLLILTFMYNDYIADEKHRTLQKSCQSLQDFVERDLTHKNNEIDNKYSVYYIMRTLAGVSEFDFFVTDNTGVIKVCACEKWGNSGGCEHTGTQLDVREIKSVISDERKNISTLGLYISPHYTAAGALESTDGKTLGYVVAGDSMDDVRNIMERIAHIYIISAIVPLILMFLAIFITTYRLTKPLKLMSD
ncbi:MAG: hypothetical protein IKU82_06660, partial [Clostridia bacterium]|nr:hypothetical protein [Clostridia bacterium]